MERVGSRQCVQKCFFQAWVAVLLVPPLLFAGRAHGSTFVYAGDGGLAEQSQAVVLANVQKVLAEPAPRGGVQTRVFLDSVVVVAGETSLPAALELVEWGGTLPDRSERIVGSPSYRRGERVLVFLQRRNDGSWASTNLALGKYALIPRAGGGWTARRDLEGAVVLDLQKRRLDVQASVHERDLEQVIAEVRRVFASKGGVLPEVVLPDPEEEFDTPGEAFSLLAQARWFEVDSGLPVQFFLSLGQQSPLDVVASQSAVEQGMLAWSSAKGSFLRLEAVGTVAAQPFSGCGAENVILFNDPFQEVSNPTNCQGVLALGGFCTSRTTKTYAGTSFHPITVGKIVFNDGWEQCGIWNVCNLAEVATHELGHTIGLGHSTDRDATMAPVAHFDGRCAGLTTDDIAGLRFLYGMPLPDFVLQPVRPLTIRIPRGAPQVEKQVTLSVRDAAWPVGVEGIGRNVRVVARDGDCPSGTVSGADFDPASPGEQAALVLNSGKPRQGSLSLIVRSTDVFGTRQSPFRCTTEIEVLGLEGEDRNPNNNVIPLTINVIDENDPAVVRTEQARDTVLTSLRPVRVTLSRTMPFQIKQIPIRLRNADQGSFPDHRVRVFVDPGDCPPGTIAGWDFGKEPGDQHEVDIPPRRMVVGTLTLTPPPGGFYSPNSRSPARCTLQVRVASLEGEVNVTNNASPLVLDVIDFGDF